MNAGNWDYDERIASDPPCGNKVVQLIVQKMEAMGWPQKELFGIHLALEEAIMNAIKHGNRCDPDKQVHIIVNSSLQSFYLRVTDEGLGFNPQDVPDPTLDENLELGSGRGLMLMKHYMDEVIYNEIGNMLELRKNRR